MSVRLTRRIVPQRDNDALVAGGDGLQLLLQGETTGQQTRVSVEDLLRLFGSGEDRLQRVIVVLRERIELVIVAAGTVNRRTGERRHHRRHDVIAIQVTPDLPIKCVLANVAQRTLIPRPSCQQSEGGGQLGVIGEESISCDLLLDKTGIGFVGVEGLDDVVAVGPSILARAVLVVAVCLREVNQIEPVPRPALAVLGRLQQPVEQLFIGERIGIAGERFDLLGRGWQPDQVEVDSADQCSTVGFHGRHK